MSEEVTVPSLMMMMMMTSTVCKESLARDTHTHTQTLASSSLNFSDFEDKKERKTSE